jgi:hypothetical protein
MGLCFMGCSSIHRRVALGILRSKKWSNADQESHTKQPQAAEKGKGLNLEGLRFVLRKFGMPENQFRRVKGEVPLYMKPTAS